MSTQQKRQFTEEFKRDAVSLIQREGYPLKDAASRLGIHPSVLGKWKRGFERQEQQGQAEMASAEESLVAENKRLKAENRRLQLERDILKKATAFFAKESL